MPDQKNTPLLSRLSLKHIQSGNKVPDDALFNLPEKVLQFGTGILLRGLPDYFIDKANRQGLFNGRIVVVKSTDSGETTAFERQDCLYTICIRGISEGKTIHENIICSSISRVLTAKDHWKDILRCAWNPEMKIIISNTTETGIQLVHEDILVQPPVSFPGKLLAFLFERYKAFGGTEKAGMVIVPTELIVNNGEKLSSIVMELAHFNKLGDAFIEWLKTHNHFCSSLVDRIVPGRPDIATLESLKQTLGYEDDLLSIAEAYCLWAIEGNNYIKSVLSFSLADENVIIKENIDSYRELKLRLLNGTHTLSCGLAFLSGFKTVSQAMQDPLFSGFISNLMLHEIAPALPGGIDEKKAQDFGLQVLDRFRNTTIEHRWLGITLQYSSKMKIRNIPLLLRHYELFQKPPENFAWGFAAYLLFMKAIKNENGNYFGQLDQEFYLINDDKADYFYQLWKINTPSAVASHVIRNKELWGTDLSVLKGFEASVQEKLQFLILNKFVTLTDNYPKNETK